MIKEVDVWLNEKMRIDLSSIALITNIIKLPNPHQVQLQKRMTGLISSSREELKIISDHLNNVKQTVNFSSVASVGPERGLVDAGGELIKWLFGTPSNKDLEQITKKFAAIDHFDKEVTHLITDQATLINETIKETRINAQTLKIVNEALESLDNALTKLATAVEYNLERTLNHTEAIMRIDDAFRAIDKTLYWLADYIKNLELGITVLALGRLPPQLFPPEKLHFVLEKIANVLPYTWSLAVDAHPGNLWLFYQETKVHTALTRNMVFDSFCTFRFTNFRSTTNYTRCLTYLCIKKEVT